MVMEESLFNCVDVVGVEYRYSEQTHFCCKNWFMWMKF